MRPFLFALAIAVAAPAFANDLEQANRLLESKSYAEGISLLTRLAGQGNAAAQLRLGQVFWYGEGVPVDRSKGDALFAQAAASGNAEAKAAQRLTAQRAQHEKDIAWWTDGYDGADLRAARDACQRPAIPAASDDNREIRQVQGAMQAWQGCHNGFVQRMADQLPPGKAIPAQVLDVMTDAEVERAKTHLGLVYKALSDEAAAGAAQTVAAYGAWEKATSAYVEKENSRAAAYDRQQKEENERRKAISKVDLKCLGCK